MRGVAARSCVALSGAVLWAARPGWTGWSMGAGGRGPSRLGLATAPPPSASPQEAHPCHWLGHLFCPGRPAPRLLQVEGLPAGQGLGLGRGWGGTHWAWVRLWLLSPSGAAGGVQAGRKGAKKIRNPGGPGQPQAEPLASFMRNQPSAPMRLQLVNLPLRPRTCPLPPLHRPRPGPGGPVAPWLGTLSPGLRSPAGPASSKPGTRAARDTRSVPGPRARLAPRALGPGRGSLGTGREPVGPS